MTKVKGVRGRPLSEHHSIHAAEGHAFDPDLVCSTCSKTWDQQRNEPTSCDTPLRGKEGSMRGLKNDVHKEVHNGEAGHGDGQEQETG